MNTFSNRLLNFASRPPLTLSSGNNHTPQNEPRSLAEIARALSRWENEGGAFDHEDTRLIDSHAARS